MKGPDIVVFVVVVLAVALLMVEPIARLITAFLWRKR